MEDRDYMEMALAQAVAAGNRGEVPVGAVVVLPDAVVVAAGNRTVELCDPTRPAEILALREAARQVGNCRLGGGLLFSTIEPCVMCMGAAIHARIARVVYGTADPRWGGAESLYTLGNDPRLNHAIPVTGGVLEERCRELIQSFFRQRRQEAAAGRS
ncbi:MAG: nucleoside deaminase [Proteobacteria bacterium]|nr:nucleoside deaminase [Pseudomonadota bacterium]